jgi:SRSO17 transposase
MSVEVVRQSCGQLGKVDNCEGVVFATLGRGHFLTPIDCRLFMPGEEFMADIHSDR